MDMYDVSTLGSTEVYMIPGAGTLPTLSGPSTQQLETMYGEGGITPEFAIEQGFYYPAATNYGYICTGIESPADWDDHQRIFGLDGQEVQYVGGQTESSPYVYYNPSYGYAQSPYNPYNPYIPGASIGVDGTVMGAQQYYTFPAYENHVSLPAYYPMVVQPGSDAFPNIGTDTNPNSSLFAYGGDAPGSKPNLSSASSNLSMRSQKPASNHARDVTRRMEGPRANAGPSKQPMVNGNVGSSNLTNLSPSQTFQGRDTHSVEPIPNGRPLPSRNQLKVSLSTENGFSNFGASAYGRAAATAKVRPKLNFESPANETIGIPNAITEQNMGLRTDKSKAPHLAVKAYTSKAGETDAKGNIIIQKDEYNKDDFQVDYIHAKFFVIKSYSEDDVHKSIKYKVWSSTPNGNKKLEISFQDAERIASGHPRGCPVFLFFSVNASGQFCGLAEMIGHVDFNRDMDFWQQDKWNGSFPVKWHFIKDIPNPNFRHIILENNENKPVTNSRDTQEIRFKQGIEMLKIFKKYSSKTSLLDDFMYYENRQRIMQQEKSRMLIKSFGPPFLSPGLDSPRKISSLLAVPSSSDEVMNIATSNNTNVGTSLGERVPSSNADVTSSGGVDDNAIEKGNSTKTDGKLSSPKIGLLNLGSKEADASNALKDVATGPIILTVGSMPVKVNGLVESRGILRVGSIPIHTKSQEVGKSDGKE
ncbi:YTH domain-containing protein ECT4 [Impatiens glandulifera]|uniref:YTH domain-containing protein ECT4 n=1 Tax=Impatiens glandulifera TaxID=253017 RepID=UPI001FB1834A|nr:YTH domain-containing protein ECT4 [Impatiens glandulifera]XP_047314789.1 YTH domain-containing protein ECT4 [Impatiens glandulifera]